MIPRFQIDADTGDEVPEQRESETALDVAGLKESKADDLAQAPDCKGVTHMILQRLFRKPSEASDLLAAHCLANVNSTASDSLSRGPHSFSNESLRSDLSTAFRAVASNVDAETRGDSGNDSPEEPSESWNYPISSFDTLSSEDRQYVRAKSKQSGSTLERDDHFFASSIFLDCVVQAERSRRLAVHAVDLLSQRQRPDDAEIENTGTALESSQLTESQSAPSLFPTCATTTRLVETMNARFSKQLDRATYEVRACLVLLTRLVCNTNAVLKRVCVWVWQNVRAFQAKQVTVNAVTIQAGQCGRVLSTLTRQSPLLTPVCVVLEQLWATTTRAN